MSIRKMLFCTTRIIHDEEAEDEGAGEEEGGGGNDYMLRSPPLATAAASLSKKKLLLMPAAGPSTPSKQNQQQKQQQQYPSAATRAGEAAIEFSRSAKRARGASTQSKFPPPSLTTTSTNANATDRHKKEEDEGAEVASSITVDNVVSPFPPLTSTISSTSLFTPTAMLSKIQLDANEYYGNNLFSAKAIPTSSTSKMDPSSNLNNLFATNTTIKTPSSTSSLKLKTQLVVNNDQRHGMVVGSTPRTSRYSSLVTSFSYSYIHPKDARMAGAHTVPFAMMLADHALFPALTRIRLMGAPAWLDAGVWETGVCARRGGFEEITLSR